jgi:tRNA A37 threonylcarbamoyltransferase TsaD
LNEYWKLKIENWKFLRPVKKVYSTDNGAMIWLAGILAWNDKK